MEDELPSTPVEASMLAVDINPWQPGGGSFLGKFSAGIGTRGFWIVRGFSKSCLTTAFKNA